MISCRIDGKESAVKEEEKEEAVKLGVESQRLSDFPRLTFYVPCIFKLKFELSWVIKTFPLERTISSDSQLPYHPYHPSLGDEFVLVYTHNSIK